MADQKEALALFVRFVRLNPDIAPDDPVIERTWRAYQNTVEEVPDVEVTYDEPQPTLAGSLVHVEAPERPLERRRSGAKNVSAPEYQNAFISEARASMGQPSRQDAEALIGHVVKLTFNVDWSPVEGVLTHVKDQHGGSPYLLLDDYRERAYPLNAIQRIEAV